MFRKPLFAMLDLTEYLYDPQADITRYKVDLIGDITFDRQLGLIYLFERLADGDKSVVHVWQLPTT